MRVLGLVPARSGSKGVPGKNIRLVAGRPLLAYTADAALAARSLDRVVLSTDDPEIEAVGLACGLEVPFRRPAALATDDTASIDVVLHALEALAGDGDRYDAVCLLQPTNPLRSAALIDRCVERLVADAADTVMTVLAVPAEHHPWWVYLVAADGSLRLANGDEQPVPRRQLLPPAFHREGSVYVTRTDVLMQRRSFYGDRVVGELVDAAESVNIDTFDDLARAEVLLTERAGGTVG